MVEHRADPPAGRRIPRRAGRPPKPVLSRAVIADAALDLVTDAGVDALTMKSVAVRLGVSVSSLYNHITNKAELLTFVQDAVMSRVDAGAFTALTPGVVASVNRADVAELLASALRSWSRSYRQAFAEYPSMVPLIATMPVSGAPATRRMYDTVASGLLAAGVPSEQVIPVIVAFESFLFGSAMDVHAPASIFGSRPEETDAPAFQSVVDDFTARVDVASGAADHAEAAGGAADHVGAAGGAGAAGGIGAAGGMRAGGGAGATGGMGAGGGAGATGGRAPGGGANPYADQPFEWGLDGLIAHTLALLD